MAGFSNAGRIGTLQKLKRSRQVLCRVQSIMDDSKRPPVPSSTLETVKGLRTFHVVGVPPIAMIRSRIVRSALNN